MIKSLESITKSSDFSAIFGNGRRGSGRGALGRGVFRYYEHPITYCLLRRGGAASYEHPGHGDRCPNKLPKGDLPNVILPMYFLPTCKKVEMLNVEMRFTDMPF